MTLEATTEAPTGEQTTAATEAPTVAAQLVEKPFWDGFQDAELKGWAEKNNLKDVESTAKQLRDAQRMIGDNTRVSLPKEGDDITQSEIWDKLNVPKEAKGYELKRPTLPDGMAYDEGFEGEIKEVAAKLRAPPHVVQGMLDAYAQKQIADFTALKQQESKDKADLDELYKEWGVQKGPDGKWQLENSDNVQFAKRFARFAGLTQEEITALDQNVLGGSLVMKAMAKIGRHLKEGALIDGDSSPVIGAEAALSELNRLNDRIAAGEALSKDDLARRSRLYKEAAPLLAKQGR